MPTMQELCDRARIPLNDENKDRYLDADLLVYGNTAIRRAYQLRPDLKFGAYATEYSDLALTGAFPLPSYFFQPVADYIAGRMNTVDDEIANGERAVVLMELFEAQVMQ